MRRMNRQLGTVLLIVLGLCLQSACAGEARPNIVFFLADDLGYAARRYFHETDRTPLMLSVED